MVADSLSHIPPRRYTERPLPAYRHQPGYSPHPVRDALGHSYDQDQEPRVCPLAAGLWRECDNYLYGVDLFNCEFFWEAHEAWEPVWHHAGHASGGGIFVKAMIQGAAVMLLYRTKRPGGIERLLARAARNFEKAFAVMGLDASKPQYGFYPDPWLQRVARYVRDEGGPFPFIELEI